MKNNESVHMSENDVTMNELSLEEMDDVNGGGIKEIVAATTLAAMAMTGNTVSAFGMANAMAEESSAHVEAARVEEGETFGAAFEENAVMADDIEVAADPVENTVFEEDASLGEDGAELGGEAEEAPTELSEMDLGEATDDVVEDAPAAAYVMNVGECSRVSVSRIAKAAGVPIDPKTIDSVGIVDEEGAKQFNIIRDGGELYIQPKQDIDKVDVGLVAGDRIEVVTLENIRLDKPTSAAMEAFKNISDTAIGWGKDQAKAWAKKGITALCELVPEGKFAEPVFQWLFDQLMGSGPVGPDKLTQIATGLGELREEMKSEAEAIKKSMSNVTTMAAYGSYLDKLSTSCSKVMMNLKAYGEANLPENDKMVLIASLLTDLDSDKTDNLFGYILMESAVFNGTSAVSSDGRDLFRVAYDLSVPNAMFSGEAMDLSKDYIRRSVNHFTASYSVATTCLEAYLRVFEFTEDDVLNLGDAAKEKYAQLCKVPETIYNAFETLNATILGKGGAMEHYNSYKQTYRYTFINKGRDNIKLSRDVIVKTHKTYGNVDLIEKDLKSQPINDAQARAIAEHAINVRKTTPYYYLRNMCGFNMPNLAATAKSYLPGRQSIESETKRFRIKSTTYDYYYGYVGNSKELKRERVLCHHTNKSAYPIGRPIIFQPAK